MFFLSWKNNEIMYTEKCRDIVSIRLDKRIIFSLDLSLREKKRGEGGGEEKCNKTDSLESLHTALTENTCSETNIPRDYKVFRLQVTSHRH